eukprot:6286537-Prymnesium_polylepis.1
MVRGVGKGVAGQQRVRLTRDARAPQAAMQCPGAQNAAEEQQGDVEVPPLSALWGPERAHPSPRAMAVGVGPSLAARTREGGTGRGR